uniref:Uncharacterized protein n=1 Tax=Kalanchoe fedtschenkoi TaxID=63787 RepID=A0A7N0TZE1_KALFE
MKGVVGGMNSSRRAFGPPQGPNPRDEDLVLFRELQKRQKDRIASLLSPVSDEFEPIITAGANNHAALFLIPSNKKTSWGLESLSGVEKNDYDWLKTPPATPLFPSLEMEAASAPEMAVQKELPVTQPLSRARMKMVQEVNPKPKTPSTNRPKPSPAPLIASTVTNKPFTIHPDPFLTSNLSRPDPRSRAQPASSSRPKSRGSVSPSPVGRQTIRGVSDDHTAATFKTEKRSLSSTRGRAVEVTPPSVNAADPRRPLSTTRSSRVGASSSGTNETTPLRAGESRRQSCSPSVSRGRGTAERMREGNAGGGRTTTQSPFFGSKMVDKVMSARKTGGVDAAAERAGAAGGGGRLGKVVARMAVKPTLETKGGVRRSCRTATVAPTSSK